MRIAIVDDQQADRLELIGMLDRYFTERSVLTEYDCFSCGEDFLKALEPGRWEIVFLDIYMEGADGMTVARTLREQDRGCRLIFFTTSNDHAVLSYGVRASYYLTKPTSYAQLCDAMEVCTAELLADNRYLQVEVDRLAVKLFYRDILYFESRGHSVLIHTVDKVLTVQTAFGQLTEGLRGDDRFYPTCRGVLVNLDWVREMPAGDFLLKNGELVPVRQRGRAEARQAFLSRSLRDLLDTPQEDR